MRWMAGFEVAPLASIGIVEGGDPMNCLYRESAGDLDPNEHRAIATICPLQKNPNKRTDFRLIVCDSVPLLLKSRLDWILAWTLKIIVLDLVFNQENGYWMQLCTCASDGEDERKVVWLVS